jgi:hypothetical protein
VIGRDYPAGARLGPYTVVAPLGRGAMGVVYEARDPTGAPAAVKVATEGAPRFAREARSLARLEHPNVVRFLGASEGAQAPAWLAMELVRGEDLERRLARGRLAPDEAARLVAQVAAGVAHAHERGLIHRDLKPSNVLIDEGGRAVVTDFGLTTSLDATRLTRTGAFVGTLAYASPEQATGQEVGPASDVWAVGALLYHALTGTLPFAGETMIDLVHAITRRDLTPPAQLAPDLPRHLAELCLACLEVAPDRRPSARDVARALQGGQPLRTARRGWLAGAVAALVATSLGAGLVAIAWLRPAAPPAAGDDWTRAWAQGDAAPARLEPRVLWRGPNRAAPVEAVASGDPGTLEAAYLGEARRTPGGRVEVRYDLVRAARAQLETPGTALAGGVPGTNQLVRRGDAVAVLSPNDASTLVLWLGDATWTAARLRVDARLLGHVDQDHVSLGVGHGPTAGGLLPGQLTVAGRRRLVAVGSASLPFGLDDWTPLEIAPWAPAGERVRVGTLAVEQLDAAAADLTQKAGGRAVIALREVAVGFRSVSVEGLPVRTDLPARARAPVPGAEVERLSVTFTAAEGSAGGGPLLELGAPEAALRAELDGARLRIVGAGAPLATLSLAAPARRGTLRLERRGPRVSVEADLDCGRSAWSGLDPAPRPPGPPAWGSTGPAVSFEAVEYDVGSAPTAGSDAWTRGARRLASLVDLRPTRDDSTDGRAGLPRRRLVGDLAARELELAGDDARLGADLRADALARAVLARVVAGDSAGAERAATRLVALAGQGPAARAVDALEQVQDRAVLLARLAGGWANVHDNGARDAGLRAALVLAPEQASHVWIELAAGVPHRTPRPRAGSPEARAASEERLALLSRAQEAGAGDDLLDAGRADVLTDLERFAEAVTLWDRALAREPVEAWWWIRRSQSLSGLGRQVEALESAVGGLAHAGLQARGRVSQLLNDPATRATPGLQAAVLVALDRLGVQEELVPVGLSLAERALTGGSARDRELGRYVLVGADRPAGQADLDLAAQDEPAAALWLALRGADGAAARLRAVAARDPLVRHLALLDPRLAPLLVDQ